MKSSRLYFSGTPLIITLILFISLAFFIRSQLDTILAKNSDAPEDQFSAERAFTYLQELTREQLPHFVDSTNNKIVAERIVKVLRQLGYQEEIQEKQICRDSSRGLVRCTRVRNIIVHIAGEDNNNGILLSAHYDSVPAGPGGSDAGAAVGTLLEVARLLNRSQRPRNAITLLFNEGEEFGLFGAQLFMEHHLAKNIKLALNVEARGSGGQSVMFETGENSGWLVEHYANSTPKPLSSSLFYEVYKYLPNDTDFTIFKRHGLQGLNFAHAEREPHYHTPLDNLENLDRGSLQHHGDNVWGVLNSIKNISILESQAGNLIYTDILGLFVVSWDEKYSLVIAGVLLLLLCVIYFQFAKKQLLELKQVGKSLMCFFIILISAVLVSFLVQKSVQFLSSTPMPWRTNQLPMQVAIWSAVGFVSLWSTSRLNKNISASSHLLAVASVWGLLTLVTCSIMPGISFLFIIPTVTILLGLFLCLNFTRKLWMPVAVISAIVIAISFFPVAYVLEIMVSYQLSVAIGVILGFSAIGLMPLLSLNKNSRPTLRRVYTGLLIMMLVGVGATSWQAKFSPWMPQHVNITYLQTPSQDAFILAGRQSELLPASLKSALGETAIDAKIPWLKSKQHFVSHTSLNIPDVNVQVKDANKSSEGKSVELKLSTESENLVDVALYIPVDGNLTTIESYGKTLNYSNEKTRYNGYYEYRCRGESCSKNTVTLNFSSDKKVKVLVAKFVQGLPISLQSLAKKRGQSAVPRQQGDQSIIVSEIEI